MIQRIQSVYLLLAGIAMGFAVGFYSVWHNLTVTQIHAMGIAGIILAAIATLMSIGAIFLYQNRKQQQKIVSYAQWITLLVMGLLIAILLLQNAITSVLQGNMGINAQILIVLPLVAYVFLFLARRRIQKDEALVRSMDRIR